MYNKSWTGTAVLICRTILLVMKLHLVTVVQWSSQDASNELSIQPIECGSRSTGAHFGCYFQRLDILCSDICKHQLTYEHPLQMSTRTKTGHAFRITLQCVSGHAVNWTSWPVMGSSHALNYWMMHAYQLSWMATVQCQCFRPIR